MMMLLAKALYDNIAESPDELAMRRGDILTVLERDTSGLEGWWLCQLKGRRGIVPGNRLRVLDNVLGQREMALMNAKISYPERSAPQKEWHDPNKVVTPQRLGNMFVYDVPRRLSPSGHYDIPPSARTASDYDHPPSRRPPPTTTTTGKAGVDVVDVGPVRHPRADIDHYDVPGSNRSSTASMMSTGSTASATSSASGQPSSFCESERSSVDLSGQELYDVPPPARALPTPAASKLRPAVAVDGPTYDTPKWRRHGRQQRSKGVDSADDEAGADSPNKDADSPIVARPTKPVSRNCSADSGISLATKTQPDARSAPTYDVPVPHRHETETPGEPSAAADAAADDDEPDYDRPKCRGDGPPIERGPADVTVYDVPPRVTKDTGAALEQEQRPAADEATRPSSCSSDSDGGVLPYDELRMELTAAMESIVGLQHDVNSSCSKLLSFVRPGWRRPDELEPRIYQIKLSAIALNAAGDQFVRFAHGALANAAKSDDRRLTKKLRSAIESLSTALTELADCLRRLNADMWPLVKLVRHDEPVGGGCDDDDDDLDAVVRIAGDIPECVRRISGLIQGNSLVLFRRGADSSGSGAAPTASTPKPRARQPPPPPPVKPKPRLSVGDANGNVAPLARFVSKSVESTPTSERAPPLKTSTTAAEIGADVDVDADKDNHRSSEQADYDVPKTASVDVDSPSSEQRGLPDGATNGDEYDYVSLTKDPVIGKTPTAAVRAPKVDVDVDDDDDVASPVYAQVEKKCWRGRQVTSLFPPTDASPDWDPTGKLEERFVRLQKEAEEPVRIHTTSDDYDVPHSRPVESRTASRSPPSTTAAAAAGMAAVSASQLSANERQLLSFYAIQAERHSAILTNAIEAFVRCIDDEQPPKVFIAHSKFVILAAHKLVYIGDTLTRHLQRENVRNDVMGHAYALCELLKGTVTATKKAALEFPAVQAVQDMVDKVSEVSVAASRFRSLLLQFAS